MGPRAQRVRSTLRKLRRALCGRQDSPARARTPENRHFALKCARTCEHGYAHTHACEDTPAKEHEHLGEHECLRGHGHAHAYEERCENKRKHLHAHEHTHERHGRAPRRLALTAPLPLLLLPLLLPPMILLFLLSPADAKPVLERQVFWNHSEPRASFLPPPRGSGAPPGGPFWTAVGGDGTLYLIPSNSSNPPVSVEIPFPYGPGRQNVITFLFGDGGPRTPDALTVAACLEVGVSLLTTNDTEPTNASNSSPRLTGSCEKLRTWALGSPPFTRVCGTGGGTPRCWALNTNGSIHDLGLDSVGYSPPQHNGTRPLLCTNTSEPHLHSCGHTAWNGDHDPQRCTRTPLGKHGQSWSPQCHKSTGPNQLGERPPLLITKMPDGNGTDYVYFLVGGPGNDYPPLLARVCEDDCWLGGHWTPRFQTVLQTNVSCANASALLKSTSGNGGPIVLLVEGEGGNGSICTYSGPDTGKHFAHTPQLGETGPRDPLVGACGHNGDVPESLAKKAREHPHLNRTLTPSGGPVALPGLDPRHVTALGTGPGLLFLGTNQSVVFLLRMDGNGRPNGTLTLFWNGTGNGDGRAGPRGPVLGLRHSSGGGAGAAGLLAVLFGDGVTVLRTEGAL
ncbi:MC163 [Molluscum contagiosum virus subtype 2]|uniref:MC163 n=2 Tax=Molluscum contagiosum virus TaxID=10279 RepID=A0A1S7DMH9_MCV2|nr:MC163 [Molluscum contagiosum virus subtype 2]QHW16554.1 MC163R [Molluscum contagiosum virus]AYO87799.1 MC163 [Molluscum contagiosum virus subtype 2]AYO87969.1 MC163 [Molluscum contagiosum virus subtype 2]AYO88139.1 MC163 [Molluscum contagiosum virus subtype 2]